MANTRSTLALALYFLATSSCTTKHDGSGGAVSTETGGETASPGASSEGTTGTTGTTGTAGGDANTSSSTTGVGPDPTTFREMCESIEDQEGCDAVPFAEYDISVMWCSWAVWVPVEVGASGECVFGAPTGQCEFQRVNEGEEFWNYQCPSVPGQWRLNDDGNVEVGTGTRWGEIRNFCQDSLPDTPPACDCICDDSWPGLPPRPE